MQCRMGAETAVRLPDEHAEPTAATVLPDDITITPNAQGDFVLVVSHRLGTFQPVITAGVTAASATILSTGRQAAFAASARLARTVKTKVQVMYIGAEQTSSGYISVTRKTNLFDSLSFPMSALHSLAERQVRAQEGVTVYVGHRQTPRFEDPTASTFMEGTVPVLVIAGSGLPNIACIKVRILRFLEFLPAEGDLFEGETQPEPHNPASLQVHGQMSIAQTSIHTDKETAGWAAKIANVASAAYHVAQPFGQYVVPRARQYLAGLAKEAFAAAPLLLGM